MKGRARAFIPCACACARSGKNLPEKCVTLNWLAYLCARGSCSRQSIANNTKNTVRNSIHRVQPTENSNQNFSHPRQAACTLMIDGFFCSCFRAQGDCARSEGCVADLCSRLPSFFFARILARSTHTRDPTMKSYQLLLFVAFVCHSATAQSLSSMRSMPLTGTCLGRC